MKIIRNKDNSLAKIIIEDDKKENFVFFFKTDKGWILNLSISPNEIPHVLILLENFYGNAKSQYLKLYKIEEPKKEIKDKFVETRYIG